MISIKAQFYLFFIKSTNHDMYLQKLRKSTLSPFDEKCRLITIIENTLWN